MTASGTLLPPLSCRMRAGATSKSPATGPKPRSAPAPAGVSRPNSVSYTHLAIRELGVRPGVTLNPATPLATLEEILPFVDLVLVMSVNPGFGGQSYIPTSTAKIARLRGMLDAIGSTAELEVDGGIKPGNAAEVAAAGATVLVAGSAIFGGPGTVADNVAAFQAALPL